MSELTCLRCHIELEMDVEACPQCGDKVTQFQRSYAGRLIDGKYQILDRLGVGGMGEIFKVRHIHLGEQRVIKIMRANIASDDDALQRFLHEAKLATMIKHRNLAMLYDFSTLEDGSYYMVWEFIDGVNIQKWISKNGPVPPRLAVEIAIQALSGLEALHQMGIAHRDISPENIMLSQDYQGKLLSKVIDFGIAKQLSDAESGQGLTQTGMFLGKLKYASPEQAGFLKEGEQLDSRSDLYSFGIVVYEMLAGRAPFMATNPQSYILKHATEKPPAFTQVNPNVKVPAKLEAIVFKALEKDRASRHANAASFIAELEAVRAEIPPDEKFGLGEKMITLSSTPTIIDTTAATASRRQRASTGTKQAPTVPRSQAKAGQSSLTQQPTLIEKTPGTLSDRATIIERTPGGQGAAATMVESLAGAAPTLIEPKVAKWQQSGAAPTVMERKMAAPAKKRSGILIGIAAGVVLAVGGAVYVVMQPDAATPPIAQTETSSPPGTVAGETTTVTSASLTQPVISPDGSAPLWALGDFSDQLTKIEDLSNNRAIELSAEDDLSLPFRKDLPAGRYRLTFRRADGKEEKTEVELSAGKEPNIVKAKRRKVDVDKLVNEVLQQQ